MFRFLDYYQNNVDFSYDQNPFSSTPAHVWIVTRYKGKWVLTKHKKRGLEFPGGKVEPGENPEQAARREIREELGAEAGDLHYIGQYKVHLDTPIIKNVFFTELQSFYDQDDFHETEGPVLTQDDLVEKQQDDAYSFIMKDDVLKHSLAFLNQLDKGSAKI
ncbi:RNA deprotection pyrophosphohydrolase [Jeotgalibacillus sp. R-1-5s-1]|uniref:RNA deprotection pyrophosphohydrolase n=1 Tax=Jeotgalibacillus sp. R-1-5s-1 TaxID=2555897 RepID=UPI001068E3D8|nr:nucleoside triphosphatase YtkD [Jeotgalibacillus sp. R-1-5s-1]TFD98152.1 nucleoside triphosphatase YtkD [Jeotgalibacillus sp. R-1-5s-1]